MFLVLPMEQMDWLLTTSARLVPTTAAGPSGHGVDHEVHGKLGVVLCPEALVAPVVIPLAAVVLVRIEHRHPAFTFDGAQIVVHHVVAPAIEFMRSLRRAVGKIEEG